MGEFNVQPSSIWFYYNTINQKIQKFMDFFRKNPCKNAHVKWQEIQLPWYFWIHVFFIETTWVGEYKVYQLGPTSNDGFVQASVQMTI